MENNKIRIIKLGKEAITELVREALIEKLVTYMDVSHDEVMTLFDLDFERCELIFCALPDTSENTASAPGINTQAIIKNIPCTTDSLFDGNARYREYTKDEFETIIKGIKQAKAKENKK